MSSSRQLLFGRASELVRQHLGGLGSVELMWRQAGTDAVAVLLVDNPDEQEVRLVHEQLDGLHPTTVDWPLQPGWKLSWPRELAVPRGEHQGDYPRVV